MTPSRKQLFCLSFVAATGLAPRADAQVATRPVKGAVTFEITTLSGDVEVTRGGNTEVKLEVQDGPGGSVKLESNGTRVTPRFDKLESLRSGKVRVWLPSGSTLIARTTSGDVSAVGLLGDVDIRSTSGDVSVRGCKGVVINTVSGDIHLSEASGAMELETVSGDAKVNASPEQARLRFKSTSGELEWRGRCGLECRVSADTLSGGVLLELAKTSSFDLSFRSFSGDWEDVSGVMTKQESNQHRRGRSQSARYGKGEGKIEVETFSGELSVKIEKK
jgi:DUF4097 and DUF4098 domain-containing protein YvlB